MIEHMYKYTYAVKKATIIIFSFENWIKKQTIVTQAIVTKRRKEFDGNLRLIGPFDCQHSNSAAAECFDYPVPFIQIFISYFYLLLIEKRHINFFKSMSFRPSTVRISVMIWWSKKKKKSTQVLVTPQYKFILNIP